MLDCSAHIHAAEQGHPWIDPYGVWHYTFGVTTFPAFDAFLAIAYQNQAPIAAKIDHEFIQSREIFPTGTPAPFCAVLRVKYADGSVWTNPSPPQP